VGGAGRGAAWTSPTTSTSTLSLPSRAVGGVTPRGADPSALRLVALSVVRRALGRERNEGAAGRRPVLEHSGIAAGTRAARQVRLGGAGPEADLHARRNAAEHGRDAASALAAISVLRAVRTTHVPRAAEAGRATRIVQAPVVRGRRTGRRAHARAFDLAQRPFGAAQAGLFLQTPSGAGHVATGATQ
jgi:hypothetical protein